MRLILCLLVALPLTAQGLGVPCEAPLKTLRALETVPPLEDFAVPYERRVGALRTMAQRNPNDFFIQRAYQDSFRHRRHLAEEFDRALSMYRDWTGPLARYHEARLLMYSEPKRSRAVFEALLKEHGEFVWPHLEFIEWSSLPGRKSEDTSAHSQAFATACPEALAGDVRGLRQDPAAMRRALQRRNTWLDLAAWPRLWTAEETGGVAAKALQARVRADLKRIESWAFRPYPRLLWTFREAGRILQDARVLDGLRARVEKEAADSTLACALARERWQRENPPPKPDNRQAYQEYEDRKLAAEREWLRRWPGHYSSLQELWLYTEQRSRGVASVTAEALEVADRWVRFMEVSPDATVQYPPLQTALGRMYAASKVRLEQVPRLLDLGLRMIESQEKYSLSLDLFPEEMRPRVANWRELTAVQTAEARVDYFLATGRAADARAIVEQALANPARSQGDRGPSDQRQWLVRLGDVEAAEGRVQDALAHYQAGLGVPKEHLAQFLAMAPKAAAIKQYYLAHGGTEEQWPEWASAKPGTAAITVERTPPAFVKALPEFSAADLAGKTWQLSHLNGKATFVNLWATWCGPCRAEHSYLQTLFESVRDRKDVQVLTLSVDDSPGAVRDYMKEKGYTFPVIHASQLADQLFPFSGLPTNFLVNAQGVRTGLYGFGGSPEATRRVIEDLENAAKAR